MHNVLHRRNHFLQHQPHTIQNGQHADFVLHYNIRVYNSLEIKFTTKTLHCDIDQRYDLSYRLALLTPAVRTLRPFCFKDTIMACSEINTSSLIVSYTPLKSSLFFKSTSTSSVRFRLQAIGLLSTNFNLVRK